MPRETTLFQRRLLISEHFRGYSRGSRCKGMLGRIWGSDSCVTCDACRFADQLLQNLWRWLCSPAAVLACPGLQRSVAALMRKTLAHLVRTRALP